MTRLLLAASRWKHAAWQRGLLPGISSPFGPLDAVGVQGTTSRRYRQGAQAMAKSNKSRAQQTLQEQQTVTELLAELEAIEERRQYAVSFHTLMDQHGPLEIPVQYERLFLHSPTRKEENQYDYRRHTPKSHQRRVSHRRV